MNKIAFADSPGADGLHRTYCRLCEAQCGMVAHVKQGRIERIEPDRDHPVSEGHVCIKGTSFAAITHDPDRVLTPLKRVGGPGDFKPVSWDEALDDIAARLKAILTSMAERPSPLTREIPPLSPQCTPPMARCS